jgi:hypothetical protein
MIAERWDSTALRERVSAAAERAVATERRTFLVVFAGVLVTRLPFLDAGYGDIKDAWRVASAARLIGTTHDYWASRFPPHPVHEIASAFLWKGGPLALNLATAVVSSIGIACFALAARRLRYDGWLPATAALAMTPQVYISSTTTIDYLWALSFMLAALLVALRGRSLAAGVLVGFAIGARITSAAMLLPLSLLFVLCGDRSQRLRHVAVLWASAIVIGLLWFVPAIERYGADALTFAEIADYRPYDVVRRATLETWGVLGFVGLVAAALYAVFWRRRGEQGRGPSRLALVWLCGLVVYTIAFLRLPHLPAYLIPAIPFALLLLHELVPKTAFTLACAAIVVAPFLGVGRSGPEQGAILLDRARRTELRDAADRFVADGNALDGDNVVVAGHWYAPVYVYVLERPDASTRYAYLLTAREAARARANGKALYYLPGARELNLERHRVDLIRYGARPLPTTAHAS